MLRLVRNVLLFAALYIAATFPALAQQNYNINNWYWVAQDTNPTTQVFSSATGTFIANNNATYLAWLANGTTNQYFIAGAANNGSGLVRLTLVGTRNFQTGQYWNVAGTGLYDQNWIVTVIDSTHLDLQGSTYTAPGTLNTSYLSGSTVTPTAAGIYQTIDSYNQTLTYTPFVLYAPTGPVALTNQLSVWTSLGSAVTLVTLPQADMPGGPPLGKVFFILNSAATGSSIFINNFAASPLKVFPGNTVIGFELIDNTTTGGTWLFWFVPLVDPANGSNLDTGTVPAARLPAPTASTLGGVESLVATAHQWINTISTAGVPSSTQPAFTDISGSVAASQLPNPTASTLGGIESITSLAHNWIAYIDTAGVPHQSQPAFSDLSGSATAGQLPAATYAAAGIAMSGCNAYTPTDQSGASLTFSAASGEYCISGPSGSQMVTVFYSVTYPPTADGSAAKISAPVPVPNQAYAVTKGSVGIDSAAVSTASRTVINSSVIAFTAPTTNVTTLNSALSASTLSGSIGYPLQ